MSSITLEAFGVKSDRVCWVAEAAIAHLDKSRLGPLPSASCINHVFIASFSSFTDVSGAARYTLQLPHLFLHVANLTAFSQPLHHQAFLSSSHFESRPFVATIDMFLCLYRSRELCNLHVFGPLYSGTFVTHRLAVSDIRLLIQPLRFTYICHLSEALFCSSLACAAAQH